MGKYRGPKIKLLKRLGYLYGFSKKKLIRTKKLIKTKKLILKKKKTKHKIIKKKRPSIFLRRFLTELINRQKIRFLYGLSKTQLLNYIKKTDPKKHKFSLFNLIESRIDSILFRLSFFKTIPEARQAVVHKHILINNNIISSPNYICKYGDSIKLKMFSNLAGKCVNNILSLKKKYFWIKKKSKKINLFRSYNFYKYSKDIITKNGSTLFGYVIK